MTIAERCRRARKAANLTQVQLSAAAGCDPSTISRIERGDITPSIALANRIAQACGVSFADIASPDDAIGNDEDEPHPASVSSFPPPTAEGSL